MEGDVQITLSRDQALVLSAWLDRHMTSSSFTATVDDRAVWSPLLRMTGALESILEEVFSEDYENILDSARARLNLELGDFAAE